jgi:hypothetical protein
MYDDHCIDIRSRDRATARRSRAFNQEDTMKYLKDLIERLGKALGIKSPAHTPASMPTNPLGPVQGPAQKPL